MMTKVCLMLLLSVAVLLSAGSRSEASEQKGYYMQYGRQLDLAQVVEQLEAKAVVIFGEYHDNSHVHAAELELWQLLCESKRPPALSMEMFERDVQPVLNAYLAAEISEEEFLGKARPWPNYQTDYKPLIKLAGRFNRPVIAANIPRFLAAEYAKSGSLDASQQQFLPRRHMILKNAYYELFMNYMLAGEMAQHMNPEKAERYYQAQSLKDDTMAESIADYLNAEQGERIYHVQGAFHSRGKGGVAEKLLLIKPDLQLGVITSVYEDELDEINQGQTDEIFFVVARQKVE